MPSADSYSPAERPPVSRLSIAALVISLGAALGSVVLLTQSNERRGQLDAELGGLRQQVQTVDQRLQALAGKGTQGLANVENRLAALEARPALKGPTAPCPAGTCGPPPNEAPAGAGAAADQIAALERRLSELERKGPGGSAPAPSPRPSPSGSDASLPDLKNALESIKKELKAQQDSAKELKAQQESEKKELAAVHAQVESARLEYQRLKDQLEVMKTKLAVRGG